ncbi:MAG: ATP-binding protein [Gemmatimonadales bacterium]
MALVVASVLVGEWLRTASPLAAGLAVGACLGAAVLAVVRVPRRLAPGVLLAAAAVLLGASQLRLDELRHKWSAVREERVLAASSRLAEELRVTRLIADSLAARAVAVAAISPDEGFDRLTSLLPDGVEAGVAVLEPSGVPRLWAGRFRAAPEVAGDSIGARLTPYYAMFEARRHAGGGRVAVATVLLTAHEVIPDRDKSVAAAYERRTGVPLRILPPRLAPDSSDVFDYQQPTTSGVRTLFSALLVPPEQRDALESERVAGGRRVAWLLLLTLLAGVVFSPPGIARVLVLAAGFAITLRAPLGDFLGLDALFDPRRFSAPWIGLVSATPAALGLLGALITVFAVMMWRRALPRSVPGVVLAGVLVLGAPYVISAIGRDLSPPPSSVSTPVWLAWQVALFLAAAGLVTLAAALVRGRHSTRGRWQQPVAGAVIGIAAAAIGVLVWNARYGWPDWYTFLWTPALVLVIWPADRRAAIAGIALVAGSAAALVTWGAEVEGRLAAARRDIASLGDAPDPAGQALLRGIADRLAEETAPRNATALYALWQRVAGPARDRPVSLGLWSPEGEQLVTVALDRLDLPDDVIGALVRLDPAAPERLFALPRSPALHHLLLARRDSATIIAVALGPRTALVPPTRLGRLLTPASSDRPPYRLTIAPAPSRNPPNAGLALWSRQGRLVRGERVVEIAGDARDVFGVVDLGAPGGLAVRGALIMTLDALLFAALWGVALLLAGELPLRPNWLPRLRSYQARLGVALSVFFLAPAIGFATWGFTRLRSEVRQGQDRIIEWTLRDAVPPSGALPADAGMATVELVEESGKVDVDLALYRSGRLAAESSDGLLPALGFVSPLVDPVAYRRLTFRGDAVAAVDGPSNAVPLRLGYQPVLLSDLSPGILASPSTVFDPVLTERQRDLAYLLLLATLAGIAASLFAARRAASALARPVADLRHAAQAFGRGEAIPAPAEPPPAEFKPVFAAFQKMAADVRAAQEDQERVARIVAWGEMASQVAHEIKNPLTPMRLGVQHLRRVHEDRDAPLGPVLDETAHRILAEIDRLDRIARSFSRFGVPASAGGPLEPVSLPDVAREVADLYRIGGGDDGAAVILDVTAPMPAAARPDEVREALVNLVENARHAEARTVQLIVHGSSVSVVDDGRGIPGDLLSRVLEPRFSTHTSGSGLGLAIVKRLVESWGGRLTLTSEVGRGTTVRLDLEPATPAAPGTADGA